MDPAKIAGEIAATEQDATVAAAAAETAVAAAQAVTLAANIEVAQVTQAAAEAVSEVTETVEEIEEEQEWLRNQIQSLQSNQVQAMQEMQALKTSLAEMMLLLAASPLSNQQAPQGQTQVTGNQLPETQSVAVVAQPEAEANPPKQKQRRFL